MKRYILIFLFSIIGILGTGSVTGALVYEATKMTDNSYDDSSPRINNNGFVVWQGYDGSDLEIFLYNGNTIYQITNNSENELTPQMNDNGYVTWDGYDGSDWEIFVYDGNTISQITDNSYDDSSPQISDKGKGYVVWEGYDGSDQEIFVYDGITTTQLTDTSYNDYLPQINNNGYVVWWEHDGSDGEIFLALPLCECNLTPHATVIPRGGTVGFQATVTNNTDKTGYAQFAAKVTLPGGGDYPTNGFLDGPFWVTLTPYGSDSGDIWRPIPIDAPLGTYTYCGYVGRYDTGIFHECQFEFEVTNSGGGCTNCHSGHGHHGGGTGCDACHPGGSVIRDCTVCH